MQVALLQQGKTLYVTPGTSPDALLQEAQQRAIGIRVAAGRLVG